MLPLVSSVSLSWRRRAPVHTRDHRGTTGYTHQFIYFFKRGGGARAQGACVEPVHLPCALPRRSQVMSGNRTSRLRCANMCRSENGA